MHTNFVVDLSTTLSLLRITEFSNYDTASRPRKVLRLRRVDESSHNESLYILMLVKSGVVNILLEVPEILITWSTWKKIIFIEYLAGRFVALINL